MELVSNTVEAAARVIVLRDVPAAVLLEPLRAAGIVPGLALHLGYDVDHLLRSSRQATRVELPIRPEPDDA